MENIIQRLNDAIDIEYDTKNAEVDEIKQLPIEERVLKGDTISNAKVFFEPIHQNHSTAIPFKKVVVKCSNNLSKFRPGSPVLLNGFDHSYELNVLQDQGSELILQSGYHTYSIPQKFQNSEGWKIDNAKVDIRHIVKKSTAILSSNPAKMSYVSGIFSGDILPEFCDQKKKVAGELIRESQLNTVQKKGFVNAYSSKNYCLIQGPPGTGKTWLLAHLAVTFAKEGKKVLIAAPTHTAINNALQKASSLFKYPHIIKVGKSHQKKNLDYNGSEVKNIADFRTSGYSNSSEGIIVGATCYSPHTKKLAFMDWDIIIFDEAGQLSVPLAVAGMVKGNKYIFIGDHKQLPPIVSKNQQDPIFKKSVFELLFQHSSGIMLETTYRMNNTINRFSSQEFYLGKLYPHESVIDQTLPKEFSFQKHSEVLSPEHPAVLFCHYHTSHEPRSVYEANLISELVHELIKAGVNSNEIAIITPFRAQVRTINNALMNLPLEGHLTDSLFVDTIERIQGQERDVIIISLATSNPLKAKQRATFFYNINRLNVALTRARKKRIMVASDEVFKINSEDQSLNEMIKVFQSFYSSSLVIHEQSAGGGLF